MELLLILAGFVTLVLVRRSAVRQVAKGRSRFIWLFFAPSLLGNLVVIWAGVRMAMVDTVPGIVLVIVGVITIGLLVRVLVRLSSTPAAGVPTGDVPGPAFDYLVWLALGAPLLLGAALVVVAITGGWSRR